MSILFDKGILANGAGSSSYATEEYVDSKIESVVGIAPEDLDTLKELADALGDDSDFSNTIRKEIEIKADSVELNGTVYVAEDGKITLPAITGTYSLTELGVAANTSSAVLFSNIQALKLPVGSMVVGTVFLTDMPKGSGGINIHNAEVQIIILADVTDGQVIIMNMYSANVSPYSWYTYHAEGYDTVEGWQYYIPSNGLKTINGESLIGSGDIEIIGTSGGVYSVGISESDLVNNMYTLTHTLNSRNVMVTVYDNDDNMILPDEITIIDNEIVYIDFTSFVPFSGNYTIVVIGGISEGSDGESAYQIAVDNGFEGTETEWLASLKGETGETGLPIEIELGDTTYTQVDGKITLPDLTQTGLIINVPFNVEGDNNTSYSVDLDETSLATCEYAYTQISNGEYPNITLNIVSSVESSTMGLNVGDLIFSTIVKPTDFSVMNTIAFGANFSIVNQLQIVLMVSNLGSESATPSANVTVTTYFSTEDVVTNQPQEFNSSELTQIRKNIGIYVLTQDEFDALSSDEKSNIIAFITD